MDSLSRRQLSEGDLALMPTGNLLLKDRFWVSFPHLFLFALVLSGTGYGAWLTFKHKRERNISASERISMSAGINAQAQLEELSSLQSGISTTAFFEKATQIYNKYLTDRFMIPSSELDEANLIKYMEKAQVPEEMAREAIVLFTQCLQVRYGGIPGGYSREEMLQKCRELTAQLSA